VNPLTPQPASAAVNELSTCYANFTFYDQYGNLYTPIAVSYRIDAPGYNVQILDWTVFSGALGTTIAIAVLGSQNAKQVETDPEELRKVTIKITLPGGNTRYDKAYYTIIALPEATYS
jgi:hypothetical protein